MHIDTGTNDSLDQFFFKSEVPPLSTVGNQVNVTQQWWLLTLEASDIVRFDLQIKDHLQTGEKMAWHRMSYLMKNVNLLKGASGLMRFDK